MLPPLPSPSHCCGALFACLVLSSPVVAQDVLSHFRETGEAEVAMVEAEGKLKKEDLARKYASALENLEKTLTASGQLDAIVHLREELESVRKTGNTTSYEDQALAGLRMKYLKSRDEITAGTNASRLSVVEGMRKKIGEQETALTKVGKVAEALQLRKDGEQLLMRLSGGAAAGTVVLDDDPRVGVAEDIKPLGEIEVPAEKPPTFEKPFSIQDRWLESMTVPTARQRIREAIFIGDRGKKKWPLVVVSPGSIWSGGDAGRIELSAGTFIALKSRFENLDLGADSSCRYFFQNCAFAGCGFPRAGIWSGGSPKHYFENCHIKGSYSPRPLKAAASDIRAQACVFEDVEFPTIRFEKRQPADFVNDKWLRITGSRFVKCRIPLSFLLLTRGCMFENCVISDDPDRGDDVEITKPIRIDMYVSNTQIKIRQLPPAVTLDQKKYGDWKGVAIPTSITLAEMMAK